MVEVEFDEITVKNMIRNIAIPGGRKELRGFRVITPNQRTNVTEIDIRNASVDLEPIPNGFKIIAFQPGHVFEIIGGTMIIKPKSFVSTF